MALQRGTVILLAIAIFAGGFTYVVTQRQKLIDETEAQQQTQAVKLFDFTEPQMKSFTLDVQGQNLVFQQEISPVSQWWLVKPEKKKANRGAIAFLLDLLTTYQGETPFIVTAAQLADYGLTKPAATLTVQLVDGRKQKLTLGNGNFDQTKIYGRVDDALEVWLLPVDFRNGVTREFTEWVESASTTDVTN